MSNSINVHTLALVSYDLPLGSSPNLLFTYISSVTISNYARFFLMTHVGMVVLLNFLDASNRVKKSMSYKSCGSTIIN